MHNVSSIVREWKGKIRNASSSLIKAQNSKSRFFNKKVKPVIGGDKSLFSVGLGGGLNSIVR